MDTQVIFLPKKKGLRKKNQIGILTHPHKKKKKKKQQQTPGGIWVFFFFGDGRVKSATLTKIHQKKKKKFFFFFDNLIELQCHDKNPLGRRLSLFSFFFKEKEKGKLTHEKNKFSPKKCIALSPEPDRTNTNTI